MQTIGAMEVLRETRLIAGLGHPDERAVTLPIKAIGGATWA